MRLPASRARFPRTLAALLGLQLVLLALPVEAQEASIDERVDEIMAEHVKPDTPGAVVAFVRSGEPVFQRAYGLADLTQGVPFAVDSPTNIGSTSKQFTAFALALLELEGALSLDDDVRTHIPELPDFGETVTLRHLLTHTSGYREFLNALAIGGWRLEDGDHIDRREILRVVQRQPELQNSPGAEWNYNNTGYALAAMVVERVTGEDFPDWMAANVFEPLGMRHTRVRPHPLAIIPGATRGYLPEGEDGFREATDLSAAMGAGGIYTTVGDLARWMRNLRTAEFGGEAVRSLTVPYVLADGDTTNYGLGLMVDRQRGLARVHHGGADSAHRSHFAYYPDLDAGILVLGNHGGMPGTVAARITEVFVGEHMEPAEEEGAEPGEASPFDPDGYDPAAFDRFAGRYELEAAPGFVLRFWREEDRLRTQATGQAAVDVRPVSDSTFAIVGVDARVTFHTDETGAVTGLTLHQAGNHAARRLPDAEPDAEEERLDLTAFEGRYYSDEFETFYTLRIEEDALVAEHRRRADVTLTHAEGDTFSGPPPLVRVVFERDEAGTVTGFRASFVRARDILFERVDP